MSFSVPHFPSMPYHRTILEHWTYRWDQQSRRYVRASYRPLSVDEPPDNPREDIDVDRPSASGLPQQENSTTQTPPQFTGTMPAPSFVTPVLPVSPMRRSPTGPPPPRPPAPAVRSPVTIPPNTSLGHRLFCHTRNLHRNHWSQPEREIQEEEQQRPR